MVFFQQERTAILSVHPMFLGPNLREHVRMQLAAQVEGTVRRPPRALARSRGLPAAPAARAAAAHACPPHGARRPPPPAPQPVDDAGFIVTVLPRAGRGPVIEDKDISKGRVDALSGCVAAQPLALAVAARARARAHRNQCAARVETARRPLLLPRSPARVFASAPAPQLRALPGGVQGADVPPV